MQKNKIKNPRKALLLVLMLALVVCALAVTAFAAETTNADGSEAPAYHSYDFGDDSNPLAVFKSDNSLVGTYSTWNAALGDAVKNNNSVVYLREDFTLATSDGKFEGLKNQSVSITVDLNDKMLEKTENLLFSNFVNSQNTQTVVSFKNGKMAQASNAGSRAFINYDYSGNHAGKIQMDYVFENVKFYDNRTTASNNFIFVISEDNTRFANAKGEIKGNITYNNCEFTSNGNYIFDTSAGNNNDKIDITIKVNGGKVTDKTALTADKLMRLNADGDSITFDEYNGSYTQFVCPTASAPTESIIVKNSAGVELMLSNPTVSGDNTVYELATITDVEGVEDGIETTPYGTITGLASDKTATDYPLAVFKKLGNYYVSVDVYANWNDAAAEAIKNASSVIYLRADATTLDKAGPGLKKVIAKMVVDLNGKTLTKTTHQFFNGWYSEGGTTNTDIIFKNGTLAHLSTNTNARAMFNYDYHANNSGTSVSNYTFENVKFKDERTTVAEFKDDFIVRVSEDNYASNTSTITGTITYNNCEFYANRDFYIFAGASAKTVGEVVDLTIKVNGGKIISDTDITLDRLVKINDNGDSVTFGAYNGSYTKFVYPTGTEISNTVRVTDDSGLPRELANKTVDGENDVYELVIDLAELTESTAYGDIVYTEGLEDAAQYPLAVFSPNEDKSYTLVDLYATWAEAANAALEINNSVVYFRADVTNTSASVFLNDKQVSITVDLNGKTLTRQHETYLMDVPVKAAVTDTHVTFKNGTLRQTCNSSKAWRGFFSYNYETSHTVQDANVDFTFDNVGFKDEGTADCQFLFSVSQNGQDTTGVKQTFGEIVFNDCDFYLGLSKFIFNSNDSKGNVDMKFTVNGGRIYSDTDITLARLVNFTEGDSITFGMGTDGKYTEFVYPSTVTVSGSIVVTDNAGEQRYLTLKGTEDTNNVYELTVVPVTDMTETTPYGDFTYTVIETPAGYPLAVFKNNGDGTYTYKGIYETWKTAVTAALEIGNAVVYLRADITPANENTFVNGKTASITVDLNGKTIYKNNPKYILEANCEAAATDIAITFKNGTMIQGCTSDQWRGFVQYNYQTTHTSENAEIDYTFENITFIDNRTSGTENDFIISLGCGGKNEGAKVKGTVTYDGCTFKFENSPSTIKSIFNAMDNKTDYNKIDLTYLINGGRIICNKDIIYEMLVSMNDGDGDSVTFGAYNGSYTEFVYPSSVTPSGTIVVTDDTGATRALDLENKVTDGENNVYQLVVAEIEVITESTDYGDINYTVEKPEVYPLVVFKNNGDGTYTFVDFYATWLDAAKAAMGMSSSVIYFRADVTRAVGEAGPQWKSGQTSILVDLNGKTFTKADKYIFDIYLDVENTTTDIDVTFMNGTMKQVDGTDSQRAFIQYNYSEKHTSADANIDFTFNNVTFKDERTAEGAFIFAVSEDGLVKKGGTNLKKLFGTIIFNDCEICPSAYSKSVFEAVMDKNAANQVEITYVVNGGKIVVTDASVLEKLLKLNINEESGSDSVRFGANANGEYMKLVLPTGVTAPTTAFKNMLDGSMYTLYSIEGRDLAFVIVSEGDTEIEYVLVINCKDEDKNHYCDGCGIELSKCRDENSDHKCDVCNGVISYCLDINNDHVCEICGATSECADNNNDHNCDVCGKTLSVCRDDDKNHNCDVCGAKISECVDENRDHACDICGASSVCVDENRDHNCDICGEAASECADNNNDHNCDVCGKTLSECNDENSDHNCDVCGEALTVCADYDKDHKCDLCKKVMSTCADENSDHNCDVCGKTLSTCADNNNDHNCDVCGKALTACADKNNDHKCDLCKKEVSDCLDDDKDHTCDICDKKISQCADEDKNHNCDVCDKVLSDCEDANNDHACDVCGTVGLCIDFDGDGNCDVCGESLSSGEEDAPVKKTLLTTILDWFKSMIEKIKEVFTNLVSTVKTKISG